MTSNKWFPIAEEITGSTPNMVWMLNENNQMALFKPDITGNDCLIEDTPYQDINLESFPSLWKIAFLDALCRNQDRHAGNIDFLISPSNKTIAPSYDTVLSLSTSFTS